MRLKALLTFLLFAVIGITARAADHPEFVSSGIFLRGEVNSWAADASWEFSKESDTRYALYDKQLSGQFKVADASWSSACNYGSNGNGVKANTPYTLQSNTDANISCGGNSYSCSSIVLTIENGSATLLLTCPEEETEIKKGFYLNPEHSVLVPEIPAKVKVLSLNNSLIHYNDQARMFNEIAESMGKDAFWTKHTNLGKTLQYHWEEGEGLTPDGQPGARMMVRSDAWSHIILQEQTALPRTNFESFYNSVKLWVDYIRENCPNPNAVIILPVNWHYAQDWSNFDRFNHILMENYDRAAEELGVVICPVAQAYQAKYEKDGGNTTQSEWFLPGDDRHPTIRSTYLAALMEYGIIFNEDPANVTYFPEYTTDYDSKKIDSTIAAEMRKYASDALKGYKNIINNHELSIQFTPRLYDEKGVEIEPETGVAYSVDGQGASIDGHGLFKATEKGEYTVTATYGNTSKKARVLVTEAETEVPEYPSIAVNIQSPALSQNFDSLGEEAEATLPSGWRIDRQLLNPRTLGAFATASEKTMYAGGTNLPSNAKNGLWNFGADGSSDRALGGITTGIDNGTRAVNVYAHLINDGNKPFGSLDISYDIEKYRKGANASGFAVQLYYSFDGRNWTSAGDAFYTLFEKDAATEGYAEVPGEVRAIKANLPVNFGGGMDLYLAWNISVAKGTDAQAAMALAIDNVEIRCLTPEVPQYKYHIYVDDQTTYQTLGLYAWGTSELFGAWPGQAAIDEKEIGDTTFKVFGHDADSGSYSLIFNNWNQGKQLNDYNVTGGKDYYLQITDSSIKELDPDKLSVQGIENANFNITFDGENITVPVESEIEVYTFDGVKILSAIGERASLSGLNSGVYIVKANSNNITKSLKIVR